MYPLLLSTAITVPMFAHDVNGDAVTGKADGDFTKRISKNGAAFGAMTVTITEMEGGFYSLPLTTSHTDTAGVLTMRFTATGIKQINLQYRVGYPVQVSTGGIVAASFDVDCDTYQAKVWIADDNTGTTDRWMAVWYKNGQPQTSGITSPTIQVVKSSDGSDLIASTAMTQIASTGLYKYDATGASRIASGPGYIAKVQATIASATRTWYQPVSRDTP